jgi:predicted transcriptional regulator
LTARDKTQTNVYLSDEAREALKALADADERSQSMIVERLILKEARRLGLIK